MKTFAKVIANQLGINITNSVAQQIKAWLVLIVLMSS